MKNIEYTGFIWLCKDDLPTFVVSFSNGKPITLDLKWLHLQIEFASSQTRAIQ